jgi:hypothetical protein
MDCDQRNAAAALLVGVMSNGPPVWARPMNPIKSADAPARGSIATGMVVVGDLIGSGKPRMVKLPHLAREKILIFGKDHPTKSSHGALLKRERQRKLGMR